MEHGGLLLLTVFWHGQLSPLNCEPNNVCHMNNLRWVKTSSFGKFCWLRAKRFRLLIGGGGLLAELCIWNFLHSTRHAPELHVSGTESSYFALICTFLARLEFCDRQLQGVIVIHVSCQIFNDSCAEAALAAENNPLRWRCLAASQLCRTVHVMSSEHDSAAICRLPSLI